MRLNLPVSETQLSARASELKNVLDYEKLDVYRLSLKFIAETRRLQEGLPRGHSELIDQFKRASFSVALNIAEGAGRFKTADKQRFYGIARGSAMECGALLDIFSMLNFIDEQQFHFNKSILRRIVSILSSLCLSQRK